MMWNLSDSETLYFDRLKNRSSEEGKPMVLWGWKRDKVEGGVPRTTGVRGRRLPESRTVYFSADLKRDDGYTIYIERAWFFFETRAVDEEISMLKERVGSQALIRADPFYEGYSRLRLRIGEPTAYDLATIRRRLKGSPRLSIPEPRLVPESEDFDLSSFAPLALCVGSGLSAESGLPLLGSIHGLFEVDNSDTGELIFGKNDNLPQRIVGNTDKEFKSFCEFTIKAIAAEPSDSHRLIADLYKKGIVRQIFTDNMDDILEKVNVPYTRTRLSIFPDRFPAEFDPSVKALLVIGVAVDRRDVIKQARRKGLKIIAVNPVYGVAPYSRNMDYLRRGDIFFKQAAHEALPKIIQASGF